MHALNKYILYANNRKRKDKNLILKPAQVIKSLFVCCPVSNKS